MKNIFSMYNEKFIKSVLTTVDENGILITTFDPVTFESSNPKQISKDLLKFLFENGLLKIEIGPGQIAKPTSFCETLDYSFVSCVVTDSNSKAVEVKFYSEGYIPPTPSPYVYDSDLEKEIILPQEQFTALGISELDSALVSDSQEHGVPVGYKVTLTVSGSKNSNVEYYFDSTGSKWHPDNITYPFDSTITTTEKDTEQTLIPSATPGVDPVAVYLYAYIGVTLNITHIKVERVEG